jgi:tRNA A37 threonylcarbamoyladenosine synthetase subunit TsaC/SUA5/YrdC
MICSKAENQEGIERIFKAKKRPLNKQPLFVLPDKTVANSYFKIGSRTEQLIKKLWPGELSLLLLWAD